MFGLHRVDGKKAGHGRSVRAAIGMSLCSSCDPVTCGHVLGRPQTGLWRARHTSPAASKTHINRPHLPPKSVSSRREARGERHSAKTRAAGIFTARLPFVSLME